MPIEPSTTMLSLARVNNSFQKPHQDVDGADSDVRRLYDHAWAWPSTGGWWWQVPGSFVVG